MVWCAPFGHRSTVVARRACSFCSETYQHSGCERGKLREPRDSAGRPARATPGCLVVHVSSMDVLRFQDVDGRHCLAAATWLI